MSVVAVGVDVEPVSSFQKRDVVKEKRFYERVFSPGEISYCKKFRDPAPHFAARYCAKEALVKAAREFSPLHVTDAEVVNTEDGAPRFQPRTEKKEVSDFFSQYTPHLSLSHSDDTAIAFVVLVRRV